MFIITYYFLVLNITIFDYILYYIGTKTNIKLVYFFSIHRNRYLHIYWLFGFNLLSTEDVPTRAVFK